MVYPGPPLPMLMGHKSRDDSVKPTLVEAPSELHCWVRCVVLEKLHGHAAVVGVDFCVHDAKMHHTEGLRKVKIRARAMPKKRRFDGRCERL